MKACIKVVTAAPSFTEDQKMIMRRIALVLEQHGLSVYIEQKVKKTKVLKLKTV